MKLRQISIFTVCAASILLAFQNCSKTNFKAASADTTASSTSPPTPGPDSNKFGYSTALQDLRPIYYHLDMAGDGNQTLYVVSACGNFVSHDQGSTFAPVAMTGITSMITSISVDGANIYAGTSTDGLFASHDGGQTFQNILNLSKVKAITLKSCTQVSFGTSFGISQVYASGQTIVAGTYGAGVLVSHDGGQTFSGSQLSSGGTTLFLQSPSMIFASGNDIYMTVAGVQQPSGNPYPACTGQVSVPAFGLLVSHDNGDTFMALSAAGEWGFSAVATGSNIYFLGLKGIGTSQVQTGVALSSDSGQTFTYYYNNNNSPVNPSSPPDTSMSGVPISLGASALFTLTGPSKSVMRSTDSARTFSPVVIDSSVSDMIVSSLHQQGQALFVLTNHGLYVSSDNGQNFSHRSFSSDFCAYPWWAANNISASASGNVVYAGWDRHLLTSTDGGTSFAHSTISPQQFPNWYSYGNISDLYNSSVGLYLGDGAGDIGFVSSSGIYSGGSSFPDLSPLKLRAITGNNGGLGIYYSFDGTDQLTAIVPAFSSADYISSAISFGSTVIVGSKQSGLSVFKNGSRTFNNSSISQNAGPIWIRIRKLGSSVFAFGNQTWVSTDNGGTFFVPTGAPIFPHDAILLNGTIYIMSSSGLYYSTNGGASFSRWIGHLQ